MAQPNVDFNVALELSDIYARMGQTAQFEQITKSMLASTNLPPNAYLAIAQLYGNLKRWDLLTNALRRYLEYAPGDHKAWMDLGFTYVMLGRPDEAVAALKRAVETGGETARSLLRQDQRFDPLRQHPGFAKLVPPAPRFDNIPLRMFP
jgi:tetratricopeptide (TPR) repeat protein